MADGPPSKPRFDPLHHGHAIEQVALVIQFSQGLDDARMTGAEQLGSTKITDLPKRGFMQQVMVAIGPMSPMVPSSSGPAGVFFQRFQTDGAVETELRVERASLTFRTLVYTRWAEVWGRAKTYFEIFLPLFSEIGEIQAVGLTYADKFVWSGRPEEANTTLLFRPNSPYLCPHVYGAQDLWHSHTGAFLRPDDQTKRLLNVNVDVLDESSPGRARRVVSIGTALTDSFNQPGYRSLEIGPDPKLAIDFCATHMENLHDSEKETLSLMLSDEMCRRIQLGVQHG